MRILAWRNVACIAPVAKTRLPWAVISCSSVYHIFSNATFALTQKTPSGQRCRLSSIGPALFEGSEQGLALVTKTKARELLALSDGGLPSQFAPAGTVKPGGALFQALAMGRILLPPRRVGHTAPVPHQTGIPLLPTTHAAIL